MIYYELPDMTLSSLDVSSLRNELIRELKGRFQYVLDSDLCLAATLLDFRFKRVEFIRDIVTRQNNITKAKDLIITWHLKYESDSADKSSTRAPLQERTNTRPVNRVNSFIKKLKDKPSESDQSRVCNQQMASELEAYLALDVPETDENEEEIAKHGPLYCFQKHSSAFPKLARLARKFLVISATSVPSEALFSQVGLTQTDLRNRLKPSLLESLSLIKDHIKKK